MRIIFVITRTQTNQFMKKALLIFIISMAGHGVFGQQYGTAIGIKGDWSSLNVDLAQFSVKHFFTESNAFEINFGAGRRYVWLEGMLFTTIN